MKARSSLRAAGKTLNLALLSMFPSATRLRHIDVRELRSGNVTVRSYTSAKSGFPVVVLHGLTREGPNDLRLVRFCKMLAAMGMCVYTPNVEGLRTLDPDARDLESIGALLKKLVDEHKSQLGLIGVSFGGTYALLVAALPEVANTIRFVLAIGPYYSLPEVVERSFSLRMEENISPEQAYGLLTLDWKYRKILPLTAEETATFEELMAHSSCDEGLTPKESALVARITRLPQQEHIYLQWKKRLPQIASLSIKGNPTMKSLKAPIFLLHNKHDTVIPVDESVQIELALTQLNKTVTKHLGRFGDHAAFSLRDDAGLARFFYRIMLLTHLQSNGMSGSREKKSVTVKS